MFGCFFRVLFACLFLLGVLSPTHALSPPAEQRYVFSKNATGPIAPGRLSLTLRANVGDTTRSLLPNGSRMVSDDLRLEVDANGVGTFAGTARLLSPQGTTLLSGSLRGVVGVTTQRPDGQRAAKAGHLEGLFEASEFASVPVPARAATTPPTVPPIVPPPAPSRRLTASFSADTNAQAASPRTIYEARLDGILIAPPLPPRIVTLTSNSDAYALGAPITAIIINATERAIYALDSQAFCTIVQLQKQSGTQWAPVAECPLERLPLPIKVAAGETRRVTLRATAASVPTGTYRLALTYGAMPDKTSTTIYSAPLRVLEPLSGRVTVTTDKSVYQTTDFINATVMNGTTGTIQSSDGQSFCTILSLLRRTANGWQRVGDCQLGAPLRIIVLKPGEKRTVTLPQAVAAIYPPAPNFEPGEHRIDFSFVRVSANGQLESPPQIVSSAIFRIEGATPAAVGVRGNVTHKIIGGTPPPPGEPPYVHIEPLPGAILLLSDAAGRTVAQALSDSKGAYEIAAPPGDYVLQAKRPASGLGILEPAPVNFRIEAHRFSEINLEFVSPLP
jgi:hypothetical protein